MTSFTTALLVASVIATFVVAEHDSVTLLQAQLQEKSVVHPEDAHVESVGDYSLADSLACASNEATSPKLPAEAITPSSPVLAITERMRLTPKADTEDPAGATTLRAVLELMIVAIVVDGMRRYKLQKQETKKVASSPGQEAEAAAEAAWLAMVNAANDGDEIKFQKALNNSPAVSRTDTWGCTALHFAAAGGSAAIATELLKRGAEVDAADASEETPLHFAARAGHAKICEVLLGAGAKMDSVNVQDMTAFVVAGNANQEAACRLLADAGAGVAGMADEQLPPLVVSQMVRKMFAA